VRSRRIETNPSECQSAGRRASARYASIFQIGEAPVRLSENAPNTQVFGFQSGEGVQGTSTNKL